MPNEPFDFQKCEASFYSPEINLCYNVGGLRNVFSIKKKNWCGIYSNAIGYNTKIYYNITVKKSKNLYSFQKEVARLNRGERRTR